MKHTWWKICFLVAGVILSTFMYWQQSRAEHAAQEERAEAIQSTAKRVTEDVTTSLKQQYEPIISDLKGQISQLQNELRSQGKSIETIRESNIVTGKLPVKVEVTNPPGAAPAVPAPILTGIRIAAQKRIASDDPELPFGLEVVIQTDVDIIPVRLAIVCDGPIGKGTAILEGGGIFTRPHQGIAEGHENIFITKWDSPAWTPQKSIVARLFSKSAIRAVQLSRNVH